MTYTSFYYTVQHNIHVYINLKKENILIYYYTVQFTIKINFGVTC